MKKTKRHDMPEYDAYHDAKGRCTNPSNQAWSEYGGRGIKFLFTSFEQFFAELGARPEGLTLERKDNNGNYEPGNVKWATQSEQQSNRRPYTHLVRYGRGYCWDANRGKWMARIRYQGKVINLGRFDSERDAKEAYMKGKDGILKKAQGA